MANEVTVTTTDVRPLGGAIVRRAVASATLALGDVVYISSYSGNLPVVTKAAGGAVATANPFGIVVAGAAANTAIAAGEAVDVVTLGPVTGYSGMTSGNTIWVSDTAGRLSTAVGTKSGVVGLAETPETVYVRPSLHTVSS
ncbi:MAG TPA: hypothetical protein VL334_22535 [Anaerolineae bacterium]|nr:hypothetical protein [Anaerolineae bacterium]